MLSLRLAHMRIGNAVARLKCKQLLPSFILLGMNPDADYYTGGIWPVCFFRRPFRRPLSVRPYMDMV